MFTFRCALYVYGYICGHGNLCVYVCACMGMHMITVLFQKGEENLRGVPKQAVERTMLPGYGKTRTNMEV